MKTGKLTTLEIAIIETISFHSGFLKREVEEIYRKYESYDITITKLKKLARTTIQATKMTY